MWSSKKWGPAEPDTFAGAVGGGTVHIAEGLLGTHSVTGVSWASVPPPPHSRGNAAQLCTALADGTAVCLHWADGKVGR